jgi:hypothetical protein
MRARSGKSSRDASGSWRRARGHGRGPASPLPLRSVLTCGALLPDAAERHTKGAPSAPQRLLCEWRDGEEGPTSSSACGLVSVDRARRGRSCSRSCAGASFDREALTRSDAGPYCLSWLRLGVPTVTGRSAGESSDGSRPPSDRREERREPDYLRTQARRRRGAGAFSCRLPRRKSGRSRSRYRRNIACCSCWQMSAGTSSAYARAM